MVADAASTGIIEKVVAYRAASAAGGVEMSKHRMVVIDSHIIAQHYKDEGWWTCLLPGQKFAVWEDTRENRFQARSRFGKMPVVECSLKPSAPRSTRFYGEELRQLARSI